MSALPSRIERAQKYLDVVRESWKPDHDDAMKCRDCEGFIEELNSVFHWMIGASLEWREFVYRGDMPADTAVDDAVTAFLRQWLEEATEREADISQHEAKGFTVEGAGDFRQAIQDARSLLAKWVPAAPSKAVANRTWHVSDQEADELRTLLDASSQRGRMKIKPRSLPLGDSSLLR